MFRPWKAGDSHLLSCEPTQRLTEEEFTGVLSELGEPDTMAGCLCHQPHGAQRGAVLSRLRATAAAHRFGPRREETAASTGPGCRRPGGQPTPEHLHGQVPGGRPFFGRVSITRCCPRLKGKDWFHFQVPAGVTRNGMIEVGLISKIPPPAPSPPQRRSHPPQVPDPVAERFSSAAPPLG